VKTPTVPIQSVDVFLSLESGGAWWAAPTNMLATSFFNSLSSQGHQIIEVRWVGSAWYSSVNTQLGQLAAACRPATVISWLKLHYPAQEFNVIGTSAGGAAIAYTLADYGLAPFIHTAAIVSGPPFMEISKGCENVTGYAYSLKAKQIVDTAYFFFNNGPCVEGNRQWEPTWDRNSVENGVVFNYPSTNVHIFIGASDEALTQNRGRDYFHLLQNSGQQSLQFHLIPRMGHDIAESQEGLDALLASLTQ
jgi:acetyl esterase/lipase